MAAANISMAPTPHPPSLGFVSARAPSPTRGEGEENMPRCRGYPPTPCPFSASPISSKIAESSMVAGIVHGSPSAIFLMRLRRILPEHVLGRRTAKSTLPLPAHNAAREGRRASKERRQGTAVVVAKLDQHRPFVERLDHGADLAARETRRRQVDEQCNRLQCFRHAGSS
jgi:hypothetical protein